MRPTSILLALALFATVLASPPTAGARDNGPPAAVLTEDDAPMVAPTVFVIKADAVTPATQATATQADPPRTYAGTISPGVRVPPDHPAPWFIPGRWRT